MPSYMHGLKHLGLGCLLFIISTQSVSAFERFFGFWSSFYPDSRSGENVCQVCHQSGSGGNGWNVYGWAVREAFFTNRQSIGFIFDDEEDAFIASLIDVENLPTDSQDAGSNNFFEEITADAQPGWRDANDNLVQFRDDSQGNPIPSIMIPPPADVCGLIDPGSVRLPCEVLDPRPSGIPTGNISIAFETVADGFTAPVLALSAPGDNEFVYVVEQTGRVIRVNPTTGAKSEFLNFSDELVDSLGQLFGGFLDGFDERGFIGFAFHPDFQNNNKVYTYLSKNFIANTADFSTIEPDEVLDPNQRHLSVVSEWTVVNPQSSSPVATNERVLLSVDQPQFNHNGGTLRFGPDGYLYIAFGDGGGANDTDAGHGAVGNGQNKNNPLGALLRIDVDAPNPANGRYGIPAGNPFVGTDGLDEIIAYGLRNPFSFTIEPLANNNFNLYVADVGQSNIEEINRIASNNFGGNYGWNLKEGSFFFFPNPGGSAFISDTPPPGVVLPPLIDPIAEYDHDEGLSVISGPVYTGTDIRALSGHYVFGDFSRGFGTPGGRLFYLDDNDVIQEFDYQTQPDFFVTGFGTDSNNELFVVGSRQLGVNNQQGLLIKVLPVAEDPLCTSIKASNGNVAVICL